MAFYGTDFLKLFNLSTNAAYSQALSTTKQNLLINEALVLTVQNEYRNGTIPSYSTDLLRGLVVLGESNSATANEIDLSAKPFSHIMAVKTVIEDATFRATLTNLLIETLATRIVLSRSSTLRSTEQVTLTDLGNGFDGTYYVKQLSSTVYELYTDFNLTIPAYNGASYQGTGTVKRVVSVYAMPNQSQEKIGILSTPTVNFPTYQMGNNKLTVNAGGSVITSAILDYITTMPLDIDVTDSTDDLWEFYPMELLYKVNDKAEQLFAALTRDNVLYQTSTVEQQQSNK